MLNNDIEQFVEDLPSGLRLHGLYPDSMIIDGSTTEPMVRIGRRDILQFCTANYLGLANHPEIINSIKTGYDEYGLTSSGSRLVCGTQSPHLDLEKEISIHQNCEDTVVYFLATVASQAAITALMGSPLKGLLSPLGVTGVAGKRDIFFDWQSHPSIINACELAVGSENIIPYRHCDMADLKKKLSSSKAVLKLIATDGIFSADGDLAPLGDIVDLSKKYDAIVLVDDAHGVGLLGTNGRGIWEHFGVENEVDIKIGSLAKSYAGGLGAFITGNRKLTDYLRISGGHYMFGGSFPPAIALGITKSIEISNIEPWRREKVLGLAKYLRDQLRNDGYGVLGDNSPIVPIIIGCSEKALMVAKELFRNGIFAPVFRYPATPLNKARVRVTLMATHTKEQVDQFIEVFKKASVKIGIDP